MLPGGFSKKGVFVFNVLLLSVDPLYISSACVVNRMAFRIIQMFTKPQNVIYVRDLLIICCINKKWCLTMCHHVTSLKIYRCGRGRNEFGPTVHYNYSSIML